MTQATARIYFGLVIALKPTLHITRRHKSFDGRFSTWPTLPRSRETVSPPDHAERPPSTCCCWPAGVPERASPGRRVRDVRPPEGAAACGRVRDQVVYTHAHAQR